MSPIGLKLSMNSFLSWSKRQTVWNPNFLSFPASSTTTFPIVYFTLITLVSLLGRSWLCRVLAFSIPSPTGTFLPLKVTWLPPPSPSCLVSNFIFLPNFLWLTHWKLKTVLLKCFLFTFTDLIFLQITQKHLSILYYILYLEKEMAIYSSILAWRIPWTEEPGGLQSMGSQRVRYDWATNMFTFTLLLFTSVYFTSLTWKLLKNEDTYTISLCNSIMPHRNCWPWIVTINTF